MTHFSISQDDTKMKFSRRSDIFHVVYYRERKNIIKICVYKYHTAYSYNRTMPCLLKPVTHYCVAWIDY